MGTGFQLCKLGGPRMMPRSASMGLPQATPMPATWPATSCTPVTMRRSIEIRRATPNSGPRSASVGRRSLCSICPSRVASTVASLVPPMSTPSTYGA